MATTPSAEHGTTTPASLTGLPGQGQSGFRRQALVVALALIAEYLLGTGVNLYVSVPADDHRAGIGTAIAKAISNGPAALAIHATLGLLLIVGALALTVRTFAARRWPWPRWRSPVWPALPAPQSAAPGSSAPAPTRPR